MAKRIPFSLGLITMLTIVAIPMFGWAWWYPFERLDTSIDIFLVFMAKMGAFGGLAMFAVSLILSGRFVLVEKLFGGLDKMYTAHRFSGTFATVLLFIHPFALSIRRFDNDPIGAFQLWAPLDNVHILLGALSLYGLIGLVVWSITTKKSYETFIKVHRWLGLIFVLGVAHAFLIGRTFEASQFMYWYVAVLSIVAVTTFVVYSLLGDILHRPVSYKVESVKSHDHDIIEIVLKPRRRLVRFKAGQFVYVQFTSIASSQYHPFSIASGEHESRMRLVIRKVGDFTDQLGSLRPGSSAKIKGPYGGFILSQHIDKKQLWIAGGVGVTPFLSGARTLKHSSEIGNIEMLYATADKKPYGLAELQRIEDQNPCFNVTLFHQDTFGFISLHLLKDHFKDIEDRVIYVCGPPAMMRVIEQEAQDLGLQHNLHFEAFDY